MTDKTHCCNQGRNPPCECQHTRGDGLDVLMDAITIAVAVAMIVVAVVWAAMLLTR